MGYVTLSLEEYAELEQEKNYWRDQCLQLDKDYDELLAEFEDLQEVIANCEK